MTQTTPLATQDEEPRADGPRPAPPEPDGPRPA